MIFHRVATILTLLSYSGANYVMADEAIFDVAKAMYELSQNAHDPNTLVSSFSELFEEVHILEQKTSEALPQHIKDDGYFSIALDLWTHDQPYATLTCESVSQSSIELWQVMFLDEDAAISRAALSKFESDRARRIFCKLDYWDPDGAVENFMGRVTTWSEKNVGKMRAEDDEIAVRRTTSIQMDLKPKGGPWAVSLSKWAEGEEAQAFLVMVVEVMPAGDS